MAAMASTIPVTHTSPDNVHRRTDNRCEFARPAKDNEGMSFVKHYSQCESTCSSDDQFQKCRDLCVAGYYEKRGLTVPDALTFYHKPDHILVNPFETMMRPMGVAGPW
eukprot:TRINITY_DN9481_c0_g1_i1.p1 TRINITY_DN9481_c0_g1~~TRINITY_DN9481_c0_g1_i1.p1  ORF type:complete len:108 (+),score=4.72 TRINITY_DN9481_c0_g1_i1:123-446(+)